MAREGMKRIVAGGRLAGLFLTTTALSACSVVEASVQDENDISGVVTTRDGRPEAGVWVIAQTKDLPTPYAKIVVTDDQGRYLIPDLPSARYEVWARGYGLADGERRRDVAPGATVNLFATVAATARYAAQYYPAGYWYSLLQVPAASEFPGSASYQLTCSGSRSR